VAALRGGRPVSHADLLDHEPVVYVPDGGPRPSGSFPKRRKIKHCGTNSDVTSNVLRSWRQVVRALARRATESAACVMCRHADDAAPPFSHPQQGLCRKRIWTASCRKWMERRHVPGSFSLCRPQAFAVTSETLTSAAISCRRHHRLTLPVRARPHAARSACACSWYHRRSEEAGEGLHGGRVGRHRCRRTR